ncbi:hypothetical protein [Dietzia sp. 179-F 9C3 NHS]|uniref:hypothetical protein n=1 Tax=Dietzia sp. 179-F 9C3 NHS TaxID=3374295 RepID=UPI0038793D25
MRAQQGWIALVVTAALGVAACAPDDGTGDGPGNGAGGGGSASPPATSVVIRVPVVDTIDVPGARAAMEAGQAEIARILERELGSEGWTEARPAQENASSSCGGTPGVGKFYAREMSHPGVLGDADRERVWTDVVDAVATHGFRPKDDEAGTADRGPRPRPFEYLINEHRDELTLSSAPGIGSGYGGFSVCHPWGP